MVACVAGIKRERKFAAEPADLRRICPYDPLNISRGKSGTIQLDPPCTLKQGHALTGYSMVTAMHIMRGKGVAPDVQVCTFPVGRVIC